VKTVRLPRLLKAQMQERTRLHPADAKITFNLYAPHSARMTLPDEENGPAFRDWVQLYTAKGSAGIYRVTSLDTDVGQKYTVGLQHGLCVLADDSPVFARNENGGLDEIEGTVSELLTRLWSMRGVNVTPAYWKLGTMAETPVVKYQPGSESLLQAVQSIIKKARGYALSFDQSAFPWTLNVVRLSDANPCEGRFSRNLDGVSIGMDDADLCTRVYLDDRDGYTDADTVSTWGVISTIMSVPEDATSASVAAHVADYLEAHKNPTVTIECSGADLSGITGENIDSLDLGRMCRACLPEYGATVNERIVCVEVPDVYGDPHGVRVSMSNKVETTADLLVLVENETQSLRSTATATSRRVGGASAKAESNRLELIRTSEEITDTRARMAKAGIIIDGDLALVQLLATQTTVDAVSNRVSTAEASIRINAGNIELKVSKDDVISSINQTPESVVISASRIDLSGYVTASRFSSEFASLRDAYALQLTTQNLYATNGYFSNLKIGDSWVYSGTQSYVTGVSLNVKNSYAVEAKNGETVYVYHYSLSAPKDERTFLMV